MLTTCGVGSCVPVISTNSQPLSISLLAQVASDAMQAEADETLLRMAREVGGNLAEVLLTTAHTMRERIGLRRQVEVLSAEGRLSAKVLGLPVPNTLLALADEVIE